MSLVLIASMSHENVVWVINQSDDLVCRTITGLTQRVFPVLLIIISQDWAGLRARDTIIIAITPDSSQHPIREKVTMFIFYLFIRNQAWEVKCISSKLAVSSSWRQHKNNWVQVVRIISVQIWSSLIFWSWLADLQEVGFYCSKPAVLHSFKCCVVWCGIFHLSLRSYFQIRDIKSFFVQ